MAENSFPTPDGPNDEPDELNEHVREPGDPDGLIAAEEHQRWEETHPAPPQTPPAMYKPKKLWPKIVITIVIIVVAAFGAYWIGNHEANKGQSTKKQHTSKQSESTKKTATASQTEQYMSTNYGLSFTHLKDWTVSDTKSKLTVVSPAMKLATLTGAKTSAHVVVTIQNPQTTIPGFPSNGAVASLTSQDLTYTQPTLAQRGQTYVSYLGYTTTQGLDVIYVTGNIGYQQGQAVPMSDIVQGNPLISIAFESCSNNTCSNGKSVTLNANDWQSSTASKDVLSLIESIQIQS